MREDGAIDTTSLLDFQRWSRARGDLDAILSVAQYWDSRFVDEAVQAVRRP
jgi:hypothetical protein